MPKYDTTRPPLNSPDICPHCIHDSDTEMGWDLEHRYYHRNRMNCIITKEIFKKGFDYYLKTGKYLHPWHLLHKKQKTYDYHITFTVDEKIYPHGTQFGYIQKLLKRLSLSKIFSWETNNYKFCIEHITTNCHVHLYVSELSYIKQQPLKNLNRKMGVWLVPLKAPVYVENVLKYINKKEPDKLIPDSIFNISLKDICQTSTSPIINI